MTKIRYLSLFSGIEAFSCAVKDMPEFEPVAFAEIEPFPCAVLQHHFPDVPNLGDVTQIDGRELRGHVDLIVGGSPCQGFSVAGLRKGLDDPRSSLAFAYIRLVEEIQPRYLLFENVPGILSCNHGQDFRSFLSALDDLNYSLAGAVLDSQWFGVPQRRRRMFVVGCAGADWKSASKIFFKSDCLQRNPPSRRKKGEGYSSSPEGCARNCGVSGTLCASGAGLDRPSASGNQLDYLVQDVPAYAVRTSQTGANGIGIDEETAHTLDSSGTEAVAFAQNQRDEVRQMDVAGALAAEPGMKQTTYIAQVERERERERESNLRRDGGRSPLAGRQGDVEHDRRQTGGGGDVFGTLMAAEAQKCWLTNQNLGGDCWIMEKK